MRFKNGNVNSADDCLWGWQHNYLERNSLQSICWARQAMGSELCVGVLLLNAPCLKEQDSACFQFAAPQRADIPGESFCSSEWNAPSIVPARDDGYHMDRVYNTLEIHFIVSRLDFRICSCANCLLLLIYTRMRCLFSTLSVSLQYNAECLND